MIDKRSKRELANPMRHARSREAGKGQAQNKMGAGIATSAHCV
jgi:hypothetical protein